MPINWSSILLVGASLLSWALLLVVSRVVLIAWRLDPWLFTIIQMTAGGAALIAMVGFRTGLGEALRSRHTWIYGVLRVSTAALFTAALVHTSTANAAFLGIVSVPISMIMLWIILSRRPSRLELPGHLVIVLGLAFLVSSLDGGWRNPAVLLMLLSETCVVASTLVAELHPLNQTEDSRQRARLTGVMLLASSFFMLCAAICLATLMQWIPALKHFTSVTLSWMTDPAAMLDPRLWASAIAIGVLLRGPSLFLSLKAINRVGTGNYIAGLAALPFISLALEAIAVALSLLDSSASAIQAAMFGTLMTLGSLAVIWARSRKSPATAPRH